MNDNRKLKIAMLGSRQEMKVIERSYYVPFALVSVLFLLWGLANNILDFSFAGFVKYADEKATSCVMCHEENELSKQRRTAIITVDADGLITSYEEKPQTPKGNLAVPPFYYYRAADLQRIPKAMRAGCPVDAPGSFAAWLSRQTKVHAWRMPGSRYDIGDMRSYEEAMGVFGGEKR